MDALVWVIIALMLLITLWWVLRPLWDDVDLEDPTVDPQAQALADLQHRQDAVYTAIQDLEQDFAGGKLAQADYESLRRNLLLQAADLLRQIDALSPETEKTLDDTQLEAEIDAMLAGFQATASPAALKTAPKHPAPEKSASETGPSTGPSTENTPTTTCPNCGHQTSQDDVFCARCGTRLLVEAQN